MRSFRFEPGAVARYAPDLAGHRQRRPGIFYRGNCNGGGPSSESAAVDNTSEDAENQNSAVTFASAATTVNKGIYKPTSIGIGTNVNISTPDPGVATYVGRDMYIGGKPSNTKTLDEKNAPTGSYAAEAEGLTVVRGKLAMNPIKQSWGGDGFRFGTVGFGSQFRPSEGSTVLAVAGIKSSIENMNTGQGSTSNTATVGAWTKGAWVGKANKTDSAGYDYTAKIAGPITYSYWDRDTNNGRQSVVKKQGNWFEGSDALKSDLFNQNVDLTNVNNNDYSKYNGETGYLTTLSNQLNLLEKKTNTVSYSVAPACDKDNRYIINKYNKTDCNYGLVFDGSDKTINEDCADASLNGKRFKNSERLITFKGDNTSMQQVFTIDASQLSNTYNNEYYRGVDFAFEGIPKGASVVVNVTGSSNIEFHNGWRFWWNGTEISRGYETQYSGKELGEAYATASQSIMWNFVDTQSLTIRGGIAGEDRADWGYGGATTGAKWTDDDPAAAMIGSILVPNGSFDDHVTTNGRVYVGVDFSMNSPKVAAAFGEGNSASVIDMDQERHNFPWSGSYTPDGSAIAWSKVDAADGTKLLPGSSWAIYGTVDDAKKETHPIVTVTDGGANDYASGDGELQFNYLNQKADPSKEISDSNLAFTYYIKEVTAPAGYQKSETIYYATMNNTGEKPNYVQGYVDESGKNVPFKNNPTGVITNTKITGSVSWTKVEEGDTGHAPLAGSEWKLAKLGAEGLTEEKSWTVSDQSASSETTWADTDAKDGKFTLAGLLPGMYTLTETQAPFGYEKNPMVYEFTVSSTDGSITWTKDKKPTFDEGGNAYISDSLTTTSVTIPVTKSVRNTDWPKDDNGNYVSFDFEITAATSDPAAPMPGETTIHVAPADEFKVNDLVAKFGEIAFDKDDLAAIDASNPTRAKTYTYTVKEVVPTTGAIDKLRYSKAEYQVAVTVKAVLNDAGKYTGLTTSTTVTQVKDDMGNTVSNLIGTADAPANAIPASTFTNVKVLTDLPLTGAGWTENSMLLVGAGLMLLGGIAAGAYWIATKRR